MRSRLVALVTAPALALAGLVALSVSTAAPASAAASVFPVPTSSAGLGRIVTAPNGNMWFVEKESNKLGRITPGGQITELSLFAEFDSSTAEDVDVAADGTVWVLYNSGKYLAGVNDAGQAIRGPYNLDVFGQSVRVAADGTPWVTATEAGDDFVVRVVGNSYQASPNSPACADALGRAADGGFWCRTSSGLTRLNGDASGGTAYPANNFAAYPYAIAAGPVGSIWFGRYFGGTIFTSPDDGEVGYLDAASGAITAFNTGERTAPADLVRGPDGNMWFTSIGAAKGIGHISPAGKGALTQVGGYAPQSLTFGPDGAVWFTDAANNAIVRVPTSDLQVTNVDPGAGSVFALGQGAGAAAVPVKVAGKKKVAVRQGRVPLTLACPKGTAGGCRGKVVLTTTKAVKKPGAGKKAAAKVQKLSSAASFKLKAGKKTTVRPRLTRTGTRLLKKGRATKVAVTVGGTTIGTLKVRR